MNSKIHAMIISSILAFTLIAGIPAAFVSVLAQGGDGDTSGGMTGDGGMTGGGNATGGMTGDGGMTGGGNATGGMTGGTTSGMTGGATSGITGTR